MTVGALQAALAGTVFAATFLLLAVGRIGGKAIPRGLSALAGGIVTAVLLVPGGGMPWHLWTLVDWQVILLLAGLMVLAGLAERAGLFAGIRRRLAHLRPATSLWVSLALVAATSAALLNDAAVVVLVPFLLPTLRRQGIPGVPAVVLMAVAANVGSLLTPFGNPQDAALASLAHLGVTDFLRAQGPLVLLGLALLSLASWRLGRRARPSAEVPAPAPATAHGRPWLIGCVAVFLSGAAAAPALHVGLGTVAAVAALLAYAGLRPRLGAEADRAAWRGLDWNVLALFLGLYLLTAGIPAWLPPGVLTLSRLSSPAGATAAVAVLSNAVGNVPAILAMTAVDGTWTARHAQFLVTVSTLGGALLLTGSAASLLAADQARREGVEVRFGAFLVEAVPWVLPLLVLGAWLNW